jgi:hypothetical protein
MTNAELYALIAKHGLIIGLKLYEHFSIVKADVEPTQEELKELRILARDYEFYAPLPPVL